MNKKLKKFKRIQLEKKKTSSRKKIIEQFTFQGFFTVSLIAGYFSTLLLPVFGFLELSGLDIKFGWKLYTGSYAFSWLISFWIFCLAPKYKAEE